MRRDCAHSGKVPDLDRWELVEAFELRVTNSPRIAGYYTVEVKRGGVIVLHGFDYSTRERAEAGMRELLSAIVNDDF